ncbi:hypothetical protein BTJ68_06804 [Hortaea werneckii EXF-2000]|uniref:Uncharacterized protein n=1 Tax=Hortaea werneckii EXF-2000 TaxID=1157616 RepID=A0A1Z5T969_HORWE|nr:hypothetical protein BTJ68_06804 [Hortaea werneckii EXF-2000]
MESLTLSDYRGSTRFPAPISYDSSPRLPTPEASCSGSEGIGNSSSRRQSRHRTSLNDTPFSSTMDCYKTGSRSFASPRRLHATPHSPPVQFSESQKPSLPPLKTYYQSTSKPYSCPECIATKTVRTSVYDIYLQASITLSKQKTEDRTATRMLSINTAWYDESIPHRILQSSP